MKSLTVWRGHSTRPSLPVGTVRKANGHLSGARPLHLACARPFGRLKAPLGLSLLRCAAQTRACRVAGGTGSHLRQRKTERSRWGTPCCTYRYRMWILAGCVFRGAPCFCFAFNFLTHDFRPPACMICYRLVAGSVIFSISSNVGIAGIAPWRLVVMLAALLAKARMPSSLSTVRVFSSSFQSLDRAAPKKVSPAPLVSPTLQGTPAT